MAELFLPGSDTPHMIVPHTVTVSERKRGAAQLIVQPHPFERRIEPRPAPAGATILEMVAAAALPVEYHGHVRVWVNDTEVPRDVWGRVRPKEGSYVYVKVTPQGGDGGKNVLAAVLMLVVVAAAAFLAPMIAGALFPTLTGVGLSVATSVIGAGLTMVGTMLVNALIPPPSQSDGLVGQRALLSGVRNQFAPYASIPRIFGKRRVYPLQGARPYTEAEGKNRYLRVLLVVGWGPLKITNIKIGDTPIANFANITYEVREGFTTGTSAFGALPAGKSVEPPQTMFTKSVNEETFNLLLPDAGLDGGGAAINTPGAWVQRTTDTLTEEISVDVTFPFGLTKYTDSNGTDPVTLEVEVQYRKVGDATWLNAVWDGNDTEDGTQTNGKLIATDESRTPTIRGGRWKTGLAAQYEVRLRRSDPRKMPESKYAQRIEWTALRSIKYEDPISLKGLSVIAMRIKATDQFSSIPDTINCEAQSYLPIWSGSAWTYNTTSNPAWAYADVMRRRGIERLIPDSRIDVAGILQWAQACNANAPNVSENYWTFNGIFENGAIFTALRQIAAHGRASFVINDGKYSVVRDVAQTVPVQHITPRNSWGYSGAKSFIDRPHGFKVGFINAANGYQEDEVIAYDDGYSEANATLFESFDMLGCTSRTMAWREGRYQLAVGQLRPEEHTVMMDVEQLRCTMGDYVLFSNDAISVGIGNGRIKSVLTNAGNITGFVLDNEVPMIAGVTYVLRIRRSNGATVLHALANVSTSANVTTVNLQTPVVNSSNGAVGDLFMFGRTSKEAAPMIVKRIEPGPDLTAKVTLVDAQPGVWTADTVSIPAFQTYISDDTPVDQQRPSAPTFTLKSDETVIERQADGSLPDRIAVFITSPPSSKVKIGGFDVQWRKTGTVDWQGVDTPVSIRTVFIMPVTQGKGYDVRVRSVSEAGSSSDWVTATNHVVIGKTTPPATVANFIGDAFVNGVQLSWDPNPEIDVVSYEVRRGLSWGTAEVVTKKETGNTLFVTLDTRSAQTFLIRATDIIGLQSSSPASVTVAVAAPGDVTAFEAYPQGDSIQFKWKPVSGDGILYEIRNGANWPESRRVVKAAGNSATVKWPIRTSGSPIFWIKAVSTAGVYSVNALLTNAVQAPVPSRNIIADTDYSSDTFAGAKVGLVTSGTGAGSSLRTTTAPDALFFGIATYCRKIDLGASFYCRNWMELDFTASAGSSLTWAGATFTWGGAGDATWLGAIDEDATNEILAFLAIEDAAALPADLVEGWRLESGLTGTGGTVPVSAAGMVFAACRFTNGLNVASSANATWNRSVPSTFSFLIDFVRTGSMATSFTIATIKNGAAYLQLWWDAAATRYKLTGSDGNTVTLPFFDTWSGDAVTFCVSQNATTRTLSVSSVAQPTPVTASASFSAIGTWTQINLYDAVGATAKAPGTLGDMEVRNAAYDLVAFTAEAAKRKPLGYKDWKEFVAGDYSYQRGIVRLQFQNDDRSLLLSANAVKQRVDVPDIDESGNASIAIIGTTVNFVKQFMVAPEVVVLQKSGAVLAIPRIIAGPTTTGFTVRLFDAANPATAVAGTISYAAKGY